MTYTKFWLSTSIGILLIGLLIIVLAGLPKSLTPVTLKTLAHSDHEANDPNEIVRKENLKMIKNLVSDPSVTDDMACGAFFSFLAGNNNLEEREAAKKYIGTVLKITNASEQEVILNSAENYKMASAQIQINSDSITKNHESLSEADQFNLRKLGQEKSKLVKNTLKTLRNSLSRDSWNSFQESIITKVKPRIRLIVK